MSFSKLLRSTVASVLGMMAATSGAQAAVFVWDTNTGTANAQDGGGTWADGAGNWYDETTPQQNQPWSNSAGNTAVFGAGGNGAAVTTTGTVNANGLVFRAVATTAYTLNGSIALSTGSSIIFNDNSSSLASRLTLNAGFSGSNISIQKAAGSALALVTMTGTNTWSGTLSLTSADASGLFFQVNSVGTLPSASLTSVSVGTNVSLVLGAGGTWAVPFILEGAGAGSRGAIRLEASSTTLSGGITLAGNATITQNTGATTTLISGPVGESTPGRMLTLGTQGTSTGTIILAASNTFTGGLTIDVTNVRLDNAGALNSTTPNRVTFANTTLVKTLTLNGNSVTVAGLSSSAGAGAGTVRNASATPVTLTINATASNTFAGSLADGTGGGALSVIKTGTFAQALAGTNTFTGGLTLNQGDLNINSTTALGATASVFTINGGNLGNSSGAAVTIANNNPVVVNADFSASPASALDLGGGAVSLGTAAGTTRTITVTTANQMLVLGGSVTDGTTATGITKAGAGILVLGGNSTHTGLTLVTGGSLRVRSSGALGSTSSGTQVDAGARLQLENNVTITGEALSTPYLENVSGNNVWDGSLRGALLATLTLDAASGSLVITGNVNAASTDGTAHSFILTGSGTGEIQGVVSNTLVVSKTGSGTWIFAGANTYTNVTNISAGSLQVGKAGVGQTGTGAVSVAANATLLGTGIVRGSSFTLNANASLHAGDGVSAADHGTLTFTPVSSASYNLASGSKTFLDLTTATVTDGSFGGFDIGTAGYNTWVDSVTGAGGHDRLVFNGTSGTLTVAGNIAVLPSGYTPQAGDVFNLLDWAAVLTKDFSNFDVGTNLRDGSSDNGLQFDLPDLSGTGLFWDVSRFTTSGNIVVVPEPGRMGLLLLAVGASVLRRRRASLW